MPHVARIGDKSNHTGKILEGSSNGNANSIGIARVGDKHSCPYHGVTPIVSTTHSSVYSNGKLVATIGAVAGCGAIIMTASSNVNIGGADPAVPVWIPPGPGPQPGPEDPPDRPPGYHDGPPQIRVITSVQAASNPAYVGGGLPANPDPNALPGTCLNRGGYIQAIVQGGYGDSPFYNNGAFMGWGYAKEGRNTLLSDADDSLAAVSVDGVWDFSLPPEAGWAAYQVAVVFLDYGSFEPLPQSFNISADPSSTQYPP